MILKTKLTLGLDSIPDYFHSYRLCFYYVGQVGQEADNILKNNYNSIVYFKNMVSGLDDMRTSIGSTQYNTSHKGSMSDYYLKLFESGKNIFEAPKDESLVCSRCGIDVTLQENFCRGCGTNLRVDE